MVKSIIENTHIISSKVTKFIWLLGYNNFFKMDMYFETEEVHIYKKGIVNECFWALFKHTKLGNYSLKKSNSSISNILNTQVLIKKLLFKTLKEYLEGTR